MLNISLDELANIISKCVKSELEKVSDSIQLHPKSESDELITREEASKMLQVSFTTLFYWNRDGILPAQKIKSRVYYLKSAIMEKLKNAA